MRVYVAVTNVEWMPDCQDTEDHDHPPEFTATVDVPDSCMRDEHVLEDAIHSALITQCDCCVIDCTIQVLEVRQTPVLRKAKAHKVIEF